MPVLSSLKLVVLGLLIPYLSGVVIGQDLPIKDGLTGGAVGGGLNKTAPGVGGKGGVFRPLYPWIDEIDTNLSTGGLGETVQGLGIDQILNLDLDNQKVRYTVRWYDNMTQKCR